MRRYSSRRAFASNNTPTVVANSRRLLRNLSVSAPNLSIVGGAADGSVHWQKSGRQSGRCALLPSLATHNRLGLAWAEAIKMHHEHGGEELLWGRLAALCSSAPQMLCSLLCDQSGILGSLALQVLDPGGGLEQSHGHCVQYNSPIYPSELSRRAFMDMMIGVCSFLPNTVFCAPFPQDSPEGHVGLPRKVPRTGLALAIQ